MVIETRPFGLNLVPDLETQEARVVAMLGSLERYANFQVHTQNDDGGFNFSEPMKSAALRDRTDPSILNQFGSTALALIKIYENVRNPEYLESIRKSFEAFRLTSVDPFNRFFPDIVEALVCIGRVSEGPLAFDEYGDKGKEAADAEINFYKTIQRWHDLGNGPNSNPPVGNGVDGGLLDVWMNDNAAVLASSIEDAAQRLYDRFAAVRPVNLVPYDVYSRVKYALCLNDQGALLDNGGFGDSYFDFGRKLAEIIRDTHIALFDQSAFYITTGETNAAMMFKKFDAVAGFSGPLAILLAKIKGDYKTTGAADGFYAVDSPPTSGNYVSGDKQDQGFVLQLFSLTNEAQLANTLLFRMIQFQDESGHYMDFFDRDFGKLYFSGGTAELAIGISDTVTQEFFKVV